MSPTDSAGVAARMALSTGNGDEVLAAVAVVLADSARFLVRCAAVSALSISGGPHHAALPSADVGGRGVGDGGSGGTGAAAASSRRQSARYSGEGSAAGMMLTPISRGVTS